MKTLKIIAKLIFTYALCGGLYLLIELLWRQRTALSMFYLAGFIRMGCNVF